MTDERRRLLILDIDGTLVISRECFDPERRLVELFGPDEGSHLIKVQNSHFIVKLRPGLHEFLRAAQRRWRLAVWSAGIHTYVHAVIRVAIPEDVALEFIWTKRDCVSDSLSSSGILLKPLSKLWEQSPDKYGAHNTFILDDTVDTYRDNKANAIEIGTYNDDDDEDVDRQLKLVLDVLDGKLETAL
jgi:TFIIF-interacting CTD phosphatase-like protein